MILLVLPFLLLSLTSSSVRSTPAQVSVDDTSSLVEYSNINDWTTHVDAPANWSLYDNTDTFSSVQGAWVFFAFNGSEIEYWGNQGPFHGDCRVNLDDGTSQIVSSNLGVDGVPILLFSKSGLAPSVTHSINVTVANNSFPNTCELDRFVYTPFETVAATTTATTTPLPTTTTTQTSSKPAKPLKLVAIGAAIGAAIIAAIVFACCFVWKLRGRKKRSDGKSTNAAGTALLETEPESPSVVCDLSSLRPSELASGWSSAGLSRGPQGHSSVLSAHSGTSDIALVPRQSGASEKRDTPEPSMLPSPFSLSYQETSAVGRLPPVIPAPSFTTTPLHTPPHSRSRSQSPSTPALSQTPITAQPLVIFSSSGPLQHQDAGRVISPTELVLYPDEIPPAYVDAR